MSEVIAEPIRAVVDAVYRSDSRRVLATLIRLLGDFDLAEEALHEAFAAAVERWPRDGVPANPRAWLVSTGRFKAIDGLRRRARFDAALVELADRLDDVVLASGAGVGARASAGATADEAVHALVALGYNAAEASTAVRKALDESGKLMGIDLIKAALGKVVK